MQKRTFVCRTPNEVKGACRAAFDSMLDHVINGGVAALEVKQSTRTLEQNKRMWATLKDISEQVVWYGEKLTPEQWKDIFTAALKKEYDADKVVPGINGGFVVLGTKTSDMSVKKMCDLQELIMAFGVEKGVKSSDER